MIKFEESGRNFSFESSEGIKATVVYFIVLNKKNQNISKIHQ